MYRRGGAVWSRRTIAFALLSLVLLGALGACRDEGNGASSSPRASSPEAFAADYRGVTDAFEEEVDRLRAEGQAVLGKGEDALIAFYERLGTATAEALDRYRDLRPPEELASLQQRIATLLAEQAEVLDAVVAHARDGSAELDGDLQRLGRLLGDWAQANREMNRRLGGTGDDDRETNETETTSTT